MVTPLTIQRRLKTSFESQHVKRFETQVKSSCEHFYHIFSSLWGQMIWKTSPWLKFGITGLFVNTWSTVKRFDYKYPVPDCENFDYKYPVPCSLFKSSYLKNNKSFLSFLFILWNLHKILNNFKKKEDRHS